MFIMDDITGDITTRQGDTWSFDVEGISDDFDAYFSVYRGDTRERLFEIQTNPVNGVTKFEIDNTNSDKLIVPENRKTEIYYYGIKRCKLINGKYFEDTVIVGDKQIGELNKILVYPKITEGAVNGAS